MDGVESVRIALRTIRGHKLRAALTVLGVVVGIAAVVTFVTLGASLEADVVGQFENTPADQLSLVTMPSSGRSPFGVETQPVFTSNDVERLAAVEGVAAVIPRGIVRTTSVERRAESVSQSRVVATTPAIFERTTFVAGGAFDSSGLVVNSDAAGLFSPNLSVGDEVTIRRRSGGNFTVAVTGIVEDGARASPLAELADRPVFYVPTSYDETTVERPGTGERVPAYAQVTVVAERPDEVRAVKDRVVETLSGGDAPQLVQEGYEVRVRTSEDLVQRVERIVDMVTDFVTGIAVISLLVAAIGIANIMLVSVRERTREIGIMKAVGARDRDVLQLFLVESALLGLLGALVGTPLGVVTALVATHYVDLSLVLPVAWFAVAIGVGLLVGVLAGLYPAWAATRVDPIDALRHE